MKGKSMNIDPCPACKKTCLMLKIDLQYNLKKGFSSLFGVPNAKRGFLNTGDECVPMVT